MKSRLALLALAAGLSATVVALGSPHAAFACNLQTGNNWGDAQWFNTANDQGGGKIDTTVSAVGVSGASGGSHVNQTLWVGTDGATALQEWVELGYIKSIDCTTNLEFYWADERDSCFFGNCFNTHLIT